jgi:hypothetical protein
MATVMATMMAMMMAMMMTAVEGAEGEGCLKKVYFVNLSG